jgi:heme A synthase
VTDFLFQFHSGLRYLVLLAAAVTIVMLVISLTRKRPAHGGGYGAWRVFVIVLDLQVVAGLLVVFTRPFLPVVIGHIVLMALALLVAHGVSVTFRRRPAERQTPAFLLIGVALCLVLIVGGILAIGRPIV